MLQAMRTVSIIMIANIFIILAWAYQLFFYAKMLGEFLCAIMLFFVKDSYIFRWMVRES
jgi:hypothetical protein